MPWWTSFPSACVPCRDPMSDELPKGWASLRLQQLVTSRKGLRPSATKYEASEGFVRISRFRQSRVAKSQATQRPQAHDSGRTKIFWWCGTMRGADGLGSGAQARLAQPLWRFNQERENASTFTAGCKASSATSTQTLGAQVFPTLIRESSGTWKSLSPPSPSRGGLWRSWRRWWARWTPVSSGWRRFLSCSNAFANLSSPPPAPAASPRIGGRREPRIARMTRITWHP